MKKDYANKSELASIVACRSTCNVKVGAVIYDSFGIFSWGWNHVGAGTGECAEIHAIKRANKARLKGAAIIVFTYRRNKQINSKPCAKCEKVIRAHKIDSVSYFDSTSNKQVIEFYDY